MEFSEKNKYCSLIDKGRQGFKKPNSFLSFHDELTVQCLPLLLTFKNFYIMNSRKKETTGNPR